MDFDKRELKRQLKNEYNRQHYIKNKEKILKQNKQWKEDNKEKYDLYHKQHYQNNKEKIAKQQKEYNKTPGGIKRGIISEWKISGLKLFGYTYDEVYEYYLSIDNCEVCNKDISMGGHKKHMDHCHLTGIFRWVLCAGCNNHDSWMRYFD